MSTSKPRYGAGAERAQRAGKRERTIAAIDFSMPSTVSCSALLEDGSDRRFRRLVYDLLTVSTRMNAVREHLACRMGISGPQYSVLIAIGHMQGRGGVSVGALARILHVSSAFIASETGKLAQAGLLIKRPNPDDRRGVLLGLTRSARSLIARNSAEIRAVNDLFFGTLNRSAFESMTSATATLVRGSHKAMTRLHMMANASAGMQEAAE
jgi:DNA-binding MarR family transcriptional regulator